MFGIKACKIIGLTGPIASGKDTVARILARHGALVIDADKVAHSLYAAQTPVWRELVKNFGSKILNRGGQINRRKLAQIVFEDPAKLKLLNSLIHPLLKEAIDLMIEEARAGSAALIVVNAAVLKEIGLAAEVDEVWVVLASKKTRLGRLLRQGLSRQQALARMNAQTSRQQYLDLADAVIENNGSRPQLNKKIGLLLD
ncbi:MAG: dephospho-CoA kinase [Candidatus Saganbacteria bacterium]|nr:dephospho-CoA kinase [Candidatus Saganbacteria bacterium]